MEKNILRKGQIIFVIGILLISACNTDTYYIKSVGFENGWNRMDTAIFKMNVHNTKQAYNFFFDIRNNKEYRYSNLYVFLHTMFPNGNVMHDTIEFILAKKNGEWIGKGMGNIKENNILVKQNLVFPDTGQYIFAVEQAMRVENLQGIEDIGIRIVKADTK